jgi:tetratricopeptide (TPR) repeat protein
MKRIAALTIVLVLGVIATLNAGDKKPARPNSNAPQYTADGQLLRPANYREWVYVSTGLGMSYSAGGPGNSPAFTTVFVNPESYKSFMQTGKWPDKTVFALEVYSSASHGSINKAGRYQDSLLALEAEVKDESKGENTWSYYGFGTDAPTAKAFPKSECWQCHEKNAAVEHSFAQFYPAFIETALAKGTVKPGIYIAPNITRLAKVIGDQGWATGAQMLDETKKRDPEAEILSEASLNSLAYMLLQKKDTSTAVELFKRVVAEHPQSTNAYDSLADGYAAAGNKPLAIEASQKELELAPKDPALNDAQKKQVVELANKRIADLKK